MCSTTSGRCVSDDLLLVWGLDNNFAFASTGISDVKVSFELLLIEYRSRLLRGVPSILRSENTFDNGAP